MKTKITLVLLTVLACTFMIQAQSVWNPQTSGTTEDLNAVNFYNENFGIAVGNNGTIIRTTDGGLTWDSISTMFTANLNGVNFFDSTHIVAVGDGGLIIKSADGGNVWANASITGINNDLLSVDITPGGHGVICGRMQIILWTDNGGNNWRLLRNDYFGTFYSAQMLDESTAFVYGENSIMNHLIGRITQPGDSIAFAYFYINNGSLTEGKIYDGYFFNPDSCVTAGAIFPGNAVITHYQPWNSTTWDYVFFKEGSMLYGLDFEGSYGVAVGGANDGSSSMVVESWDKGATWTESPDLSDKASVNYQVDIIGSTAYIVGQAGKILKKADATGIEERVTDGIQVYPNPATDFIIFKSDAKENFQVKIYDVTGNLVRQVSSSTNRVTIDVKDLSEGIYFYIVDGITGKIIIR